jgi:small-conductance mechanosensitive channel
MKIKTGVVSVLTNEVAEQTQRTQEARQQLAQSTKTIEAQKEIIRGLYKEVDFLKSQLMAWHLLVDAEVISLPKELTEENDPAELAGVRKNQKNKDIYNADGSIKKNKLN